MDVNTAIKRMIKTGNVLFGSKKAKEVIMHGKAKLVIMADNCPKEIREDIEHYSMLSKTPVLNYDGPSLELGEVCGKPFLVANLTILNPGSVEIKEVIEISKRKK